MPYIKPILIASLLIMTQFSFSQASKISVEANFPFSLGSNYFGEDYGGIIDLGAKYRFIQLSRINLGISVNGSYFKKKAERYIPSYPGDFQDPYEAAEINNFTILPRVFAEMNIESLPNLRPFIGAGYSFLIFNAASNSGQATSSNTLTGINGNLGVSYMLTTKLFAQVQYDYINLFDANTEGQPRANNISMIKLGMGVML